MKQLARHLPRARALGALVLIGCASACRSGEVDASKAPAESARPLAVAAGEVGAGGATATPAGGAAAASESAGGAGGASQKRARPLAPFAPEPWHVPVGIMLLIEPGQGLGPIRFGARLDTIERLMAEPCEQKRQESPHVLACRYSAQAVEFLLTDGAFTTAHLHRLGRPFGKDPKPDFGIFNGRFAGGAALGMLMSGVQELLGKPKAVRPVKDPNPYNTFEIHDYDGFSLEYDRLEGDRVVLGGVLLNAPSAAGKNANTRSKATQSR